MQQKPTHMKITTEAKHTPHRKPVTVTIHFKYTQQIKLAQRTRQFLSLPKTTNVWLHTNRTY